MYITVYIYIHTHVHIILSSFMLYTLRTSYLWGPGPCLLPTGQRQFQGPACAWAAAA